MLLTIAECVHGTVCGECSKNDNCITGLDGQSDYVASALRKYEELSEVHNIGGIIYYELLDQPHLYPSSEALYGLVRVRRDGNGAIVLGEKKPVFTAIEQWNTAPN